MCLQVYDLRSVPRMTSSFAFNSGPALLNFHPKLSSTLLVASARGTFTLADANGAAYSRYEQVLILVCNIRDGEISRVRSAWLHVVCSNAAPCALILSAGATLRALLWA